MVNLNCAKQVVNVFKSGATRSLIRCPEVMSVAVKDLKYIPLCKSEKPIGTFLNNVDDFLPADTKLFSWAKQKPPFSFEKVNSESLVLVHRTNFFPKGGQISSLTNATKSKNSISEYRRTVHFALNKSVSEHFYGKNWNDMEYSILLPFNDTIAKMSKSNVIGGIQDDFFFLGSVPLPKGSVILRQNPNIPKGQLKVSDAFDGVKMVETSMSNMPEATNIIIQKMGFSPYNHALQQHLGATDDEMKLITSLSEHDLLMQAEVVMSDLKANKKLFEQQIINLEEFKDLYTPEMYNSLMNSYKAELKLCDIAPKHVPKIKEFQNTWANFCRDSGYFNGLHSETSIAKMELWFSTLKNLTKGANSSWVCNGTDYKVKMLEKIFEIKANMSHCNIDLGLDIDDLYSVVKNSKTPQLAEKAIAQRFKIKAIIPPDRTADLEKYGYTKEEISEFFDAFDSLKTDMIMNLF